MTETIPPSDRPTPEQISTWRRRFAGQANNRAWELAESLERTAQDNDEMLHAAHAAMYFWNVVGNTKNRAHAALLLAQVYGLLGMGDSAKHYFAEARRHFSVETLELWEVAVSHVVEANVAAACGDSQSHATHYAEAARLIEALPDAENRQLLGATLRAIPTPASA